jgi:hypothetical protein
VRAGAPWSSLEQDGGIEVALATIVFEKNGRSYFNHQDPVEVRCIPETFDQAFASGTEPASLP